MINKDDDDNDDDDDNSNNNNNSLLEYDKWKPPCVIPLVLSTTGIVPKKLQETVKLFNLRPALHILTESNNT